MQNPVNRITPDKAIFFCCDHQQSFSKLIYGFQTIVDAAKLLIKTSIPYGIPILVTEQNPSKLGHVVNDITKELPLHHCKTFSKMTFSMVNKQTKEFLNLYPQRKSAVLFGGETHVCILQTALDLIELGYTVFLVTDGISSVRRIDRTTALKRMENAGAILTTAESVVFELLKDSSNPHFRKLLHLIKFERTQTIAKL